jgi:hypothetical protein
MPHDPPPLWLRTIGLDDPLPPELFKDSLYYPDGRFHDATPVRLLRLEIFSFVYADCGSHFEERHQEKFLEELRRGFNGYTMRFERFVNDSEMGIAEEFVPPRTPRWCPGWWERRFAHWSVWDRCAHMPPESRAASFSLLFLGWEEIAAFQAIYLEKCAPRIIALTGGRADVLGVPAGPFHDVVMQSPTSQPKYLLSNKEFWPEYNYPVHRIDHALALWRQDPPEVPGCRPEAEVEPTLPE